MHFSNYGYRFTEKNRKPISFKLVTLGLFLSLESKQQFQSDLQGDADI